MSIKLSKTKIAIASGVALSGSLFLVASAVSLGVESNNALSAGTSVTASCQPAGEGNDITVGFSDPAYVPASQTFNVDSVNLGNIATDCNGEYVKVVVADTNGDELGTYAGTISGSSVSAALSAPIDSESVGSVSVVIYA